MYGTVDRHIVDGAVCIGIDIGVGISVVLTVDEDRTARDMPIAAHQSDGVGEKSGDRGAGFDGEVGMRPAGQVQSRADRS